jgi:predicted RNA-binding Zn ribbon-like protein
MGMVHIAGNAALDLVATVSERGTTDQEGLVNGSALATWYVEAGLVDRPPKVGEADLLQARQLREHLYLLVRALVEGTPVPERSRSALNRVARRQGPVQTLGPDGRLVRRGDAGACLAAVAHAGVELFDRTDGAVVRFCADDRCTHPFLDRSRSKLRRWCDMGTCGDRAKVRRYRGMPSA